MCYYVWFLQIRSHIITAVVGEKACLKMKKFETLKKLRQ